MGSESSESSAQYIHMECRSCTSSAIFQVQHLIEECIVFKMSKEECMEALSKHANIKPVITSTVWKELEKENKEFFEAYEKRRSEGSASSASSETETETSQRIHNILLESCKKEDKNKPE